VRATALDSWLVVVLLVSVTSILCIGVFLQQDLIPGLSTLAMLAAMLTISGNYKTSCSQLPKRKLYREVGKVCVDVVAECLIGLERHEPSE
jgi:hypothetical protein